MKIMLADDEMTIVKVVRRLVEDMNYEFCYAVNGKDALDVFVRENPDLLILDIMMPRLDGFDVCEIIRKKSDVPVLFLTAKTDIIDKSVAYKMGGDDYLTKPFLGAELELRIRALLKRSVKSEQVEIVNHIFNCKDFSLNFTTSEVFIAGEKIFMTNTEYALLNLLVRSAGQPFTRNQIITAVWGQNYIGDHNALTVFIRKIREKIEKNPSDPEYLLTVWGVGYMMAEGEIEG